ncbi:hypothetical protein CCAX7_14560 [Capsulimonas corticalis]|uniref:Uncharacterized protein n=1 Tax=Capsulimonas corticalis TaxID=2219043 RepID=A0A402CZK9_9BACT|nr:hypothetical protein [Capsulimonas corticalis]BDI29405.1 hypothetical protein CCAX7_14560 [Capsulimonas corticalis]
MYDAYPTGFDLVELYASAGVELSPKFNAGQKIDSAIREWEKKTRWFPFLAGASSTRVFDPPGPRQHQAALGGIRGGGRVLDLRGGLISLDSLIMNGQNYTQGIQFWMRPDNADLQGEPFQEIEFFTPIMGPPQCIHVMGRWGYCAQVPEDAWQAILQKAAYESKPEVEFSITNGVAKVDDVTYASGSVSPLSAQAEQWKLKFETTAEDYRRSEF